MPLQARPVRRPALLAVALLVSFAAVLGCAVAAGKLLALSEGPAGSTGIDRSITAWAVAHREPALTAVARLLSTIGSQAVLTPLTLIVVAALMRGRRWRTTAMLVAAWGGAIGLYSIAKEIVQRMRPPTEIWLTQPGRSWSFPSGHATQSMATFAVLALVVAATSRRARWPGAAIAAVLVAGVGWSRVYLGVHWATDVVAGWLISLSWLAIVVGWRRRSQSASTPQGPRRSSGP